MPIRHVIPDIMDCSRYGCNPTEAVELMDAKIIKGIVKYFE